MKIGKNINTLLLLGAIAVIFTLALSTGTVATAAGTVPNDIPATAAAIDGQPHEIAGNFSLWYKFDYSVSHSEGKTQGEQVKLVLSDGNKLGLKFGVYTPEQVLKWWDNDPIGRGTPQLLSEGNLPVLYEGDHLSNDLVWVGRFAAPGTYYVQVTNDNAYPVIFTMFIEGSALP